MKLCQQHRYAPYVKVNCRWQMMPSKQIQVMPSKQIRDMFFTMSADIATTCIVDAFS
jgi:hypothetical protein